jgi:hypothetical protein
VNYCSALPLGLLTCGFFVRAITDGARRWKWGAAMGASLVAVLLFHVQVFAFLGIGLPLLLVLTRAENDPASPLREWASLKAFLRNRASALAACVPGAVLFLLWVGLRLGEPSQVEYGAPWKAWGPLLSPQNLSYKTFDQNKAELLGVLANLVRSGSDRPAIYLVLLVAAAAIAAAFFGGREQAQSESAIERWRLPALAALAVFFYFALPFDIRGYIYYLNTRYAHLAAPLAVAAVPVLRPNLRRMFLLAAAACSLTVGIPLARAFAEFYAEARALDEVASQANDRAMVMGLLFDPTSATMTHPLFLHSATVLARERGGAANFSFALTPHSPLKYKSTPPPTFPSEWRPGDFQYETHGRAYDHFLVRGVHPARIFGQLLQTELELVASSNGFQLVRRR